MSQIDTIEALEALYDAPALASMVKVAPALTPEYRAWIEASSFGALATVGPEGTDCTPRGDAGQVAYVESNKVLALPDRRGNNRIDTLRNIVRDPRCSLMFLINGSSTVIRVNGRGTIHAGQDVLDAYQMEGAVPRSVLKVEIDEVYYQCARAVIRADLWSDHDKAAGLPSIGEILGKMSRNEIDGETYDAEWPERAAKSMW